MVIADVRNIVLFCQQLFLVAQPYSMYYNSYSFQVISLGALRAMQFPFCATERLQIKQLHLFGFVGPLYNSSTLLRHYTSIFKGRKLVNEFYEFFRAVILKTGVCHTDIASRKVILLFCSNGTVRQCGMRENSLYGL